MAKLRRWRFEDWYNARQGQMQLNAVHPELNEEDVEDLENVDIPENLADWSEEHWLGIPQFDG